jgi:hypothetical protein
MYFPIAISCIVLNGKFYYYMTFVIAGTHSKGVCRAAAPSRRSKFKKVGFVDMII